MNKSGKVYLGIDEAGRGCVLGPLCIAGVCVDDKSGFRFLDNIGCQDSKHFGSGKKAVEKRKLLALQIKERFACQIQIIPPSVIDDYVTNSTLNQAERDYAERIIQSASFYRAVLDGKNIFGALRTGTVFSEDKADAAYPEVMAASIIAKDRRDDEIKRIYRDLQFPEDMPGGGYANPATRRLLIEYYNKNGKLPDEYRFSFYWKSLYAVIHRNPE